MRARDELEQVEHAITLAERVPEGRDRPQLQRGRAEPDEVRVIRFSSESSVRIHTAFGGSSMPSSFSIAITKASSFAWKAR